MDDTRKNSLDCFCQQRWIRLFSNKKTTGAPLAGFESDFGKNIIHYFTIGYGLSIEENSSMFDFKCYPNPAHNELNVQTNGFLEDVYFEILDSFLKLSIKKN